MTRNDGFEGSPSSWPSQRRRRQLGGVLAGAWLAASGCASSVSDPGSDLSLPRADPAEHAAGPRTPPAGWLAFTDPDSGVAFHYPPDLGTTYIHAHDWPPAAAVTPAPFGCTEAGIETARAGRTERRTIDGMTYCVTRVREGAAGSIYTQHAYAMPAGEGTLILTFSVRAVQCGNYPADRREACVAERASFSMDPIVHRIAHTLRMAADSGQVLDTPSSAQPRGRAPLTVGREGLRYAPSDLPGV